MMTWQTIFEYFALALNIGFLWLLMKENAWCWVLGGLASLLSIALFVDGKLYAEALLYLFYVVMAIYGFLTWNRPKKDRFSIHKWTYDLHVKALVLGAGFAFLLGYILEKYTQADYPYFDALTTSFSFIATFMEARKVLSSWVYWFIINLLSIVLYHLKGLDVLAFQMLLFVGMCVWGYFSWRKLLKAKTT
jgi:nicotinamide mononucleotide transporter